MATNFPVSLLLLISLLALTSTASSSAITKTTTPSNFVNSSCSMTESPAVCIQALSNYSSTIKTSPTKMAQTALEVSLSRARSAKKFIIQESKSKGMAKIEYSILETCILHMGLGVEKLHQSIGKLEKMDTNDLELFVTMALVDEETCTDQYRLAGIQGRLRTAIEGRITDVSDITSIALQLVSRLADGHS